MANTLITTKDIGIIGNNDIVFFEDSVQAGYDYDFYFSVLGGDSLYTWITLDDFDDDLDLSLYKRNESSSYELIISSQDTDSSYESIFNVLAEGDYIASVQFYEDLDSDTSPSTFSLKFDTKSFNENSVLPNDTYFSNQWSLFNTGQAEGNANEDILAPEAWKILSESPDVIVSVIDSGIDIFHEDLDDNIWTNDLEMNGVAGVDDDGNGFTDDYIGWNFAVDSNLIYAADHGTHVAGIIGAEGDNGQGIAGVTWDVQLMSLDVFNGGELAYDQDIIDAIYYAADNGSNVINMSLGETVSGITFEEYKSLYPDHYQWYYDAFEYATNKGAVVVIATGNKSLDLELNLSLPAAFSEVLPGVLSVAAVGNTGDLSTYSNYGGLISIAAPGGDFNAYSSEILSTLPGGNYGYMAGTSMAAPIVSGAAALIMAADPDLTPAEVEQVLQSTSNNYKELETFVEGGNFLNLQNALEFLIEEKNNAPTNLLVSASTFNENIAAASTVATLSSSDPDDGDTFTYSLVSGSGDNDNTAFTIVGDELKIKASPDYETQESYSVRLQTTDSGGLSFDKAFTLNVNDVEESPISDDDSDGFVDGSSNYKLFNSGSAIDLTNKSGKKYSDASSKSWDAIKAIKTDSGFQVLLDGSASKENQFYVWTTNSSGVITKGSGWKTADQMMQLGYEDTFDIDINKDSITGTPLDSDSDGFVDGSSNYKLFNSGTAIDLTNKSGKKYSDASTKSWDAIKSIKTDSGFQVLLDGSASKENQFYVWTTNSSGVITKGSGWKTADQMMQLGYEDTFDIDINKDSITGTPLDSDSDGFVDGSSNYKLFDSGIAIDLTNKKGNKYSDASSKSWDAIKAIKTDSGFQVLLDGAASIENQFYVWTVDSSGVITKGSGWKTGDQMMKLGYEDIFGFNINDNPGIGI